MDTSYGAWLREKRGDLSQEELASRVADVRGLKQSHISMIERGVMRPDGEQASALHRALDLDGAVSDEGIGILRREHLDKLKLTDVVGGEAA
jgi:ribosome-binding protein aMBF1 (putative translation factor)